VYYKTGQNLVGEEAGDVDLIGTVQLERDQRC